MPDSPTKRVSTARVKDAFWKVYLWDFWGTEIAAGVGVVGLAVLLSAFHIDLQYIIGAAVAVFARRLATKKIASTTYKTLQAEPERPVRKAFAEYGDPRAAQYDTDIVG